ncbi:PREDICTED: uncharacterized protein LOC104996249 isoform X2 [Bison bison bison]|uniref:Uncharacterized protein LOC104996249 isoform X2 n=1 Tax=Bison bison bison TaxID=43346 RepID=A0A6P3IAI4_BISBB|nr:PREDICTED: uncharacterized protein LOC104996249 isoform X2 [Bison bison bison]XP_010848733.1 PREDICTED: uncharacterized protein LOC104996249 isoform X2 [Bison bison bison]
MGRSTADWHRGQRAQGGRAAQGEGARRTQEVAPHGAQNRLFQHPRKLVEDLQRQNQRIKQEDRHHGNNYMDLRDIFEQHCDWIQPGTTVLRFNGCSSDICINEGEKKKDPSLMEKESPWVVKGLKAHTREVGRPWLEPREPECTGTLSTDDCCGCHLVIRHLDVDFGCGSLFGETEDTNKTTVLALRKSNGQTSNPTSRFWKMQEMLFFPLTENCDIITSHSIPGGRWHWLCPTGLTCTRCRMAIQNPVL